MERAARAQFSRQLREWLAIWRNVHTRKQARNERHRGSAVLGACLLLGACADDPIPTAVSPPAASTPRPEFRPTSVTLITGDRVHLSPVPGRPPLVRVEPGPGRERMGFVLRRSTPGHGDDISIIPRDAVDLLASGAVV